MSRWDALLDACHKRARPIVMTTIAMGAGMLPIALGIVVDPSFRGKYSGQTVKVEGEELLVMREEDVMGVLE